MRVLATLAFTLIILTAAAAQATSPMPEITPRIRWIPYRYDTRPRNVALLNDMPCSLLSHPNAWDSLYLAYGVTGRHSFFVNVPDCSAPAGSGWTIPVFFRSRQRLPDIQVAIGGLIDMPYMATTRPLVPAAHTLALVGRIDRVDTFRLPGPLARRHQGVGSRFDTVSAMPRFERTQTMPQSGLPAPDRQNPFSGPAPDPSAAPPMAPPRACCVSTGPRPQPLRSRRIRR